MTRSTDEAAACRLFDFETLFKMLNDSGEQWSTLDAKRAAAAFDGARMLAGQRRNTRGQRGWLVMHYAGKSSFILNHTVRIKCLAEGFANSK